MHLATANVLLAMTAIICCLQVSTTATIKTGRTRLLKPYRYWFASTSRGLGRGRAAGSASNILSSNTNTNNNNNFNNLNGAASGSRTDSIVSIANNGNSKDEGRGLLKHFLKFANMFQQPQSNVIIITQPQDDAATETTTQTDTTGGATQPGTRRAQDDNIEEEEEHESAEEDSGLNLNAIVNEINEMPAVHTNDGKTVATRLRTQQNKRRLSQGNQHSVNLNRHNSGTSNGQGNAAGRKRLKKRKNGKRSKKNKINKKKNIEKTLSRLNNIIKSNPNNSNAGLAIQQAISNIEGANVGSNTNISQGATSNGSNGIWNLNANARIQSIMNAFHRRQSKKLLFNS